MNRWYGLSNRCIYHAKLLTTQIGQYPLALNGQSRLNSSFESLHKPDKRRSLNLRAPVPPLCRSCKSAGLCPRIKRVWTGLEANLGEERANLLYWKGSRLLFAYSGLVLLKNLSVGRILLWHRVVY